MNRIFYILTAGGLFALNIVAMATFFGFFDPVVYAQYSPTPKVYLAQQCKAPDCDQALLESIIWCESKWEMVKNKTSSAYGYFQIIDSTERTTPMYREGKTKYDPYDNIDMGVYLYKRDGINPWLESRPCWHWRYQGALHDEPETCLGGGCED